ALQLELLRLIADAPADRHILPKAVGAMVDDDAAATPVFVIGAIVAIIAVVVRTDIDAARTDVELDGVRRGHSARSEREYGGQPKHVTLHDETSSDRQTTLQERPLRQIVSAVPACCPVSVRGCDSFICRICRKRPTISATCRSRCHSGPWSHPAGPEDGRTRPACPGRRRIRTRRSCGS